MKYDTHSIRTITEAANLTSQQNIDADIILPDYFDSIVKILKSEIIPVIEAITASGDKISVAGIAKFSLIYIGEDNKMYCYENEYRYTKVFQTQYAENSLASDVKQTVFSLNCRAIAPKRIELRAVIQVGVKIRCEETKALVSSVDDQTVITKTDSISYLTAVNCVSRNFTLTGSYPLTDFSVKPDIIIKKESKIRITEIKTIHNKAYIKGLAETEILYYSNESCTASSTALSIPLSEIIDIFGAEEDDVCNITVEEINTDILINNNDSTSIEVRLDVQLNAEITRSINADIISDVYSVKNEIYTVKDTAELITGNKKISKNESIVLETDLYTEGTYSVIEAWITNLRISPEKRGNRYNFLITAYFNALTKDENGNIAILTREHTEETEYLCDSDENILKGITCKPLSLSALQTNSGKMRFSSDMIIEGDMLSICKVTGFTSIDINENIECDTTPKFTVYFAKQNEELWSVAKENKTSIEAIRSINNITGDIITEDKMLLLPSF